MKALVLFRNDIRLDDNPALKSSFEECSKVHALYLFSPNQFKAHNESRIKINFVVKNLKLLNKDLDALNVGLTILSSTGFQEDPDIILNFFKENNFDTLYFNEAFGVDENHRDNRIKEIFNLHHLKYKSFNDQTLYDPGSIKTNDGKPYSVFTPFKRKWLEKFNIDMLDIEYNYKPRQEVLIKSNLSNFNFQVTDDPRLNIWQNGEDAARKILREFLDCKIKNYAKYRNDPILEGTSRISPYLTIGLISSRRCILEALKLNDLDINNGNKDILKWVDEIVWREFYRNIMHSFPKVSKGKPFQEYTKNINWRFDEFEFNSWKNGRTGFPIIDAAMRQLSEEGWMHNRLRMVAAMFFTKNMLHDWRLGEKYFMENLIDGDFSSNNGGWQWSASTGTDAAPYFRIFNPITQSKNFDKNGEFIKKYIPELKDLDTSVIHEPPANIREHLNYPQPILELKASRLRAIEAFKNAKDTFS